MKFSVLSGELQKILIKTGSVIPSKSALPILENYLFSLKKNNLTVTATDMDISISSSLTTKGEKDGSIIIPAKRLMDTIRALPLNVEIEISADIESCKILMKTDKGEYRLTGQTSDEYPQIPDLKDESKIYIETELLKKLITKAMFAASSDELRPAMTGVLFQIMKNEIRSVATDGHRLVKFIHSDFESPNLEKEIILPTKTLNVISRYLDEKLNSISVNDSHITFHFENTILNSKIIDVKYPNYESVIPTDNNLLLTVNKNELISSVRRASFYASSTTHQVRFFAEKNLLTISAEDIDFGSEAKETIPCEFLDNTLEIGFNAVYIIDILTHIESEEVVFKLSSPNKAAIVIPKPKHEKEELLMLVMPVRLNT